MSKKLRNILIIISCVLVVAAIVGVCVYYREEIKTFFLNLKEKLKKNPKTLYTDEEVEDFADI